jgi:hypothetical protein
MSLRRWFLSITFCNVQTSLRFCGNSYHSRMLSARGCASMFGRGSVSSARYSFCNLELHAFPTMLPRAAAPVTAVRKAS